MITAKDISACLVGRGNKPFDHIVDTLDRAGIEDIVIYDNSKRPVDLKVYGRYEAAYEAKNEWIYFQDDDVHFEELPALIDFFNESVFVDSTHTIRRHIMVANDAHGPNRGGYDDLALSAAGAIVHKSMVTEAFSKWVAHFPMDHGFLYECDFIFGVLTPFVETILPYERLYEDEDYHLCRQPWQEELKLEYTNRARMVKKLHSG